ncbi:hypothetical protein NLX83_36270 [Allokutzneria sp. A3M-2-11 16]|uniref:hypothetical protein n=1 Tax=Allokutzneria sp. A3M-2-11 16 TaxID=2962043 RepID=UPI0020B9026D|nr:hypothetical protein [Allokutzneria sp. A3M-2-11 16]MCP3804736.1 hypothetical protein [Allokutzneria sp. A3M-2-11 16]
MPGSRVVIAVAAAVLASGCASVSNSETDSVRSAADAFVGALAKGDAKAACELLTPKTLRRMEALRPEGCAIALGTLKLPSAAVREVEVWGDAAQVRTGGDTLFLREFAHGWRISGAGCTPRGDQPYDCVLEGS